MKARISVLVVALLATAMYVFAYDFSVANDDNVKLYYKKTSENPLQVEVTHPGTSYSTNDYTGVISVPEEVTKNSVTYQVVAIGQHCFRNSTVTKVRVPESVTVIGGFAFRDCMTITEVELPKGLKTIKEYAFDNSSLRALCIPASVETIEMRALSCPNLATLKVEASDPSSMKVTADAFTLKSGTPLAQSCTLLVPSQSIDLYRATSPWSDFLNIEGYSDFDGNITNGTPYINRQDFDNVDVTYVREFASTTWEPLYVPFDMSYDEWSPYADVSEVYNVRGYDGNGDGEIDDIIIEFNLLTSGSLLPNTPYVIKGKQTGEVSFECHGKKVVAAPEQGGSVVCSSTRNSFVFMGVYMTEQLPAAGNYYTLCNNAFERVASTVDVQPNSFYMQMVPKNGGYNPSVISPQHVYMSVIGAEDSTSIGTPTAVKVSNAVFYDLSGRRIGAPQGRGIFISPTGKIMK